MIGPVMAVIHGELSRPHAGAQLVAEWLIWLTRKFLQAARRTGSTARPAS